MSAFQPRCCNWFFGLHFCFSIK